MTEITYTRRMEADATSARLMWAQLGVTNQTEASIKIAGLLAQREVIERLEARITELKGEVAKYEHARDVSRLG